MSKTVVFRTDPELEARLKQRASEQDISVSEFIRKAVEAALSAEHEPTPFEAARHLMGKFGSGRDDLASDHSRILKERLRAKHDRR